MINLDELMRLHDAATPGPWSVAFYTRVCSETKRKEVASCEEADVTQKQREKNAAYICAACNAVPGLVKRIKELEAQLSAQSLKQFSALEPCRIVSNNNSTSPEWLMHRFTEVN